MVADALFLGVDGGGTRCRARLTDAAGRRLGAGEAGPANIRFGIEVAFASIHDAAAQCLAQARLAPADLARVTACLALAGASEPAALAAARQRPHGFGKAIVTADADAACIGAHQGDGGIVIAGTGSIAWAVLRGRRHRLGGWGLPVSDEGSGAWIGREALAQVLRAHDGRAPWTALLGALFAQYGDSPHAIVEWAALAMPREFATLAPRVVEHAARGDAAARDIMQRAAEHIDALATRLLALGVPRLSLSGGLAPHLEALLPEATRQRLSPPKGDPLDGALLLARGAAQSAAA